MVRINPDSSSTATKIPALSVSTEIFQPNGTINKSFNLQLNVTISSNYSSLTNTNDIDGQ